MKNYTDGDEVQCQLGMKSISVPTKLCKIISNKTKTLRNTKILNATESAICEVQKDTTWHSLCNAVTLN